MSSNYKINDYTVESQNYYDILVKNEINDDKTLAKLDVNGDKLLTEDELMEIDISDSEDETEETSDDETSSTIQQQEQEIKANYDKKLSNLYTELNNLERQRTQYYNKAGSANYENLEDYTSTAESLTSDIKSTRTEIATLLAKEETEIEELYETAASAASSSSAAASADTSTSSASSTYTSSGSVAEMMSKISSFSNGVLIDEADFIEEVCEKYGVDPALALSIMALETGYGTSSAIVNKNNPGGYMDPSTGCSTLKVFSTLEEGIEAVVRNLANNYINQGLTTISDIGAKYCPVGAANDPNGTNSGWVPSVTKIYNTLTGKNITSTTTIA